MIKMTYGGRPFDAKRFARDLEAKAMDMAMRAMEQKARGAASSIIDPETGRHADVFVDRLPENAIAIRTTGSPAFARLLDKRLGVGRGEVEIMNAADGAKCPKIYLAHASGDKPRIRPLAEYLMANGIEVWFDEWEIEPGDSLREKMEEGLSAMTHFVVALTETSITNPGWRRRSTSDWFGRSEGRAGLFRCLSICTRRNCRRSCNRCSISRSIRPTKHNVRPWCIGFTGSVVSPPSAPRPTTLGTRPKVLRGGHPQL